MKSEHKINLILVSYLNTIPFIEGFKQYPNHRFNLIFKTPSEGVKSFFNEDNELALVPVGGLIDQTEYSICTDYCIGCEGAVRTVGIFSEVPVEELKTIYLDTDSRTSVLLARIIMSELGRNDIKWKEGIAHYFDAPESNSGFLAIGDKVFDFEDRFAHFYDLGTAWQNVFHLPFAFAVFVKKRDVSDEVVNSLNEILKTGIDSIPMLNLEEHSQISHIKDYFTRHISYHFDQGKQQALKIFNEKARDLML